MDLITPTFFIVTADMLLTNVSNFCGLLSIAANVIIHELANFNFVVHFSTLRLILVAVATH